MDDLGVGDPDRGGRLALPGEHLVGGADVAPPGRGAGEPGGVVDGVAVTHADVVGAVARARGVAALLAEAAERPAADEALVAAQHEGEHGGVAREVERAIARRAEVDERLLHEVARDPLEGGGREGLGAVGGAGVEEGEAVDVGPDGGEGLADGGRLVLDDHDEGEQGARHGRQYAAGRAPGATIRARMNGRGTGAPERR
ncbi:hypothetical protein [Sorangium cellulosum]|uniref:Uncharacterized protein n=1 Tax=Sorangium cellulosum So0157-2 TaxID=1254432 RepID=S4Y6V9_SORCE|nr:hypothetical protein [Sorangium cellulosum]AGP40176.1 hypothetical protein SCE1572_40145 [Sorangium cellulosum So0157-2]